jgi:GH43 family beta-xylosidase
VKSPDPMLRTSFLVTACQILAAKKALAEDLTFSNPILPAPSQDPWAIYHRGSYFYCESKNDRGIYIRHGSNLHELNRELPVRVWQAPKSGPYSRNIWAPELHFLQGHWYIYYAADDGKNENHRMWVLESESDDPLGPYHHKGKLETNGWAIDGTVLNWKGNLYFMWSGWPGEKNVQQNLYIAPMENPYRLASQRILLTTPDRPWEQNALPICEGPQILKHGNRLFVIYSASGSWTVDYCLGLLSFEGDNILDPGSWQKHGPVFQKTETVWGIGHCSFVKSPDQEEDWILFHAKSKAKKGWNDRKVHAQKFTWDSQGFPEFGTPLDCGVRLSPPSAPASRSALDLRYLPLRISGL